MIEEIEQLEKQQTKISVDSISATSSSFVQIDLDELSEGDRAKYQSVKWVADFQIKFFDEFLEEIL